jgi:hypothetical protein
VLTAGAATGVGSSNSLATTGLDGSFTLWAVGLLLTGLALSAGGPRKATANRI